MKECYDMNKKDTRVVSIAVVYKILNQDSKIDRDSMAISARRDGRNARISKDMAVELGSSSCGSRY
jgi:hypothetical protein